MYIYTYMYTYLYIHTYICILTYICKNAYIYTYMYTHTHTYIHICIHVYIDIYIYICLYLYMPIHTYTYTSYTYMYIYFLTFFLGCWNPIWSLRTNETVSDFCPPTYLHICTYIYKYMDLRARSVSKEDMRWLQLVGSLKLYVSFAKEPCKRDYILRKRPIR